jgi:Ca2+-binding EF-hand superfamily protein
MRQEILAAMAATIIATTAAQAVEPYLPRQESSFKRVDANSDGKLEKPELRAVAAKRLQRFDANNDTSVTAAELDKMMLTAVTHRRERIMAFMDRNHDGAITQSELDMVVEAMFNNADADHSGAVTLAEAQNFKRAPWRKAFGQGGAN